MKFYHSIIAGQLIAGISFIKYAIHGGCVFGIYATDSTKEIEALDQLVNTKKITAIDQAEYEECLKKKPTEYDAWTHSKPEETPALPPIKGTGAVVVSESTAEPEFQIPIGKVETVSDALILTPVEKPIEAPVIPEVIPAAQTKERKLSRGDRQQ